MYLLSLSMIVKKILSFAASIISLLIIQLFFISNSNSAEDNIKYFSKDSGTLSLMYHRFNENKYPSTNIKMDIFSEHMQIIRIEIINFMIQNFC